ncbi:MAG: hypothetical protein Altm1KO_11440 [Alteromonas macleodii]
MDEHLGTKEIKSLRHQTVATVKSSKRVKTEDGEFELKTPRDREAPSSLSSLKKHQSRFTSMDDKILWLYAQGMSTREFVNAFDELYGAEIIATLVSRDNLCGFIVQVVEWQSRPVRCIYPIVYSTVCSEKYARINVYQ